MSKRSGFTLVELLVAISIIAILSVTAMVIYGQVTVNARDARRKLDLQNIAQALEVYYQKNGSYPYYDSWKFSEDMNWIPALVPDYMSSVPQDPKGKEGYAWMEDAVGYGYREYGGAGGCPGRGQFYVLVTQLENRQDPDRNEIKNYRFCNGKVLSDPSLFGLSWSPYSYVITPR